MSVYIKQIESEIDVNFGLSDFLDARVTGAKRYSERGGKKTRNALAAK